MNEVFICSGQCHKRTFTLRLRIFEKKKIRHLRLRYYYSEYNTTKCRHQKLLRCLKLCVETMGQRSNITQAAFIKQGQIKWSDI